MRAAGFRIRFVRPNEPIGDLHPLGHGIECPARHQPTEFVVEPSVALLGGEFSVDVARRLSPGPALWAAPRVRYYSPSSRLIFY
jgi:hypothetical protein